MKFLHYTAKEFTFDTFTYINSLLLMGLPDLNNQKSLTTKTKRL
jgi:hypothetical protein